MNKTAIRATAVLSWDDESECYVVASPLCDGVLGAGETEAEARQVFDELLDETYDSYVKGELYEFRKPGRPAKDKVTLNTRLSPAVKAQLSDQAKQWGISSGEVIEYLFAEHQAKKRM